MADNDMGALGEIYEQIMAGKTDTLYGIGTEFGEVLTEVEKVEGELPTEKDRLVVGGDGEDGAIWQGAAATAFGLLCDQMKGFITDTATAIGDPAWQTLMNISGGGLKKAQDDIKALYDEWNTNVENATADNPFNPDMPKWDAAAKKILDEVSTVYKTQGDAMTPVQEDPGDVGEDVGGGAEGDAEGGDAEGDDADADAGEEAPGGGGDAGEEAGGPEAAGADGGPDGPGGDPTGIGAPGENNLETDGPGGGPDDGPDGPGGLPNNALTTVRPGGDGGPDLPTTGDATPGIGNPKGPNLTDAPDDGSATPTGPGGIGGPDDLTDPSTKLTSFDPGSPSLIGPTSPGGGDVPSSLTSASGPGGPGGGATSSGPGSTPTAAIGTRGPIGIGPSSQLTSAGMRGSSGSAASAGRTGSAHGAGGPTGPGSQLTSAGGRGRTGSNGKKRGGRAGFDAQPDGYFRAQAIGDGDDETEESESELVGDEEWDDSPMVDSTLGRPGNDEATGR